MLATTATQDQSAEFYEIMATHFRLSAKLTGREPAFPFPLAARLPPIAHFLRAIFLLVAQAVAIRIVGGIGVGETGDVCRPIRIGG